jgi:hypothetical protein
MIFTEAGQVTMDVEDYRHIKDKLNALTVEKATAEGGIYIAREWIEGSPHLSGCSHFDKEEVAECSCGRDRLVSSLSLLLGDGPRPDWLPELAVLKADWALETEVLTEPGVTPSPDSEADVPPEPGTNTPPAIAPTEPDSVAPEAQRDPRPEPTSPPADGPTPPDSTSPGAGTAPLPASDAPPADPPPTSGPTASGGFHPHPDDQ